LDWIGFVSPLLNTILGLLTLHLLIESDSKVWLWSGFFIGILWFWWISVSFKNYGFGWAMPIGILITGSAYGVLFWGLAKISEMFPNGLIPLLMRSLSLLIISYIHPLQFDWFKMELIFTNSYLGVEKWQFAIILLGISLAIYRKNLKFLLLVILAFPFGSYFNQTPLPKSGIVLSNSMITMQDKWK